IERLVELGGASALHDGCQKNLVGKVMPPRIEARQLAVAELEAPAREDVRERLDIALRVAAIDAQRVQLHQLPRLILVQAACSIARVIEVDEHRRMARARPDEIAKAPEGMRPDGMLLVVRDQPA